MQSRSKAIVLRAIRYRDSDLIVHLLTDSGQLLTAMARSALKSKKRFGGGALEPTHHLDIVYQKKASEDDDKMALLLEAQVIDGFDKLRSDYERLQVALDILATISKVLKPGDTEQVNIYNMLGHALKNLEKSTNPKLIKVHLLARLLSQQGVLPHEPAFEPLLSCPMAKSLELKLSDKEINNLEQVLTSHTRQYMP